MQEIKATYSEDNRTQVRRRDKGFLSHIMQFKSPLCFKRGVNYQVHQTSDRNDPPPSTVDRQEVSEDYSLLGVLCSGHAGR